MRARPGDLRLRLCAVAVAAASVLSVGTVAAASPIDGSSPVTDPSAPADEPVETDPAPTTVDPFGLPANGDPLESGSRPGTTVQTRTPPPPPTTTTLPPPPPTVPSWVLPANSGSGRRAVYSKSLQRVWAVDADDNIVRSYLVSGSQFANEQPGVFEVYSKSEVATGWNFEADLPLMVRYQKTDRGNIGFHQIPIKKADGSTYQTIDQLGERLSGGCQRQHPLDAQFMWYFANVGTTVVVI